MPKKPDLSIIGQRFGRLTVTGIASNPGEPTKLQCACDCGGTKAIRRSSLVFGVTVSCGCFFSEQKSKTSSLDLTGFRFGRFVAVRRIGTDQRTRQGEWECRCDCGETFKAFASRINRGLVTSCGCAKKDTPRLGPQKWRDQSISKQSTRRARKRDAVGSFTAAQITDLYLKQRGRCANCGTKLGDKFHRDHKVALSKGGSNDISNIELLCSDCNARKHAKDPARWANENGRLL